MIKGAVQILHKMYGHPDDDNNYVDNDFYDNVDDDVYG